MISAVHTKSCGNGMVLCNYLIHDKKATTSDRVAFTYTHNLATDDPFFAAKLMAATALNQNDLKKQAGIQAGRKAKGTVMHYSLSWTEEERGEITHEEMLQAALATLEVMGTTEGERLGRNKKAKKGKQDIFAKRTQFASEHQVLIVGHEEKGPGSKPHVHIMLNRVHPEHGRILPDHKDFEKLSAWALDYRMAQGKEHLCPERLKNAKLNAQGTMTTHDRKPRHVYEEEQRLKKANDNSLEKSAAAQIKQHRAKLAREDEEQKKRHTAEWRNFQANHAANKKSIRAKAADNIRSAKAAITGQHTPKTNDLLDRQAKEMKAFNRAQNTVAGRLRNTYAAFKTKAWMHEIRTAKKMHVVTDAFKLAFSSGMQEKQLKAYHENELRQLCGERDRAQKEAGRKLRTRERTRIDELNRRHKTTRNDLVFKQEMEKAKLNAQWTKFRQDRQATIAEDERARNAQANQDGRKPGAENAAGREKDIKVKKAATTVRGARASVQMPNDGAPRHRQEEKAEAAASR